MRLVPNSGRIIKVWGALTTLAMLAFLVFTHPLPNDDLVMADTMGFRIITAALIVGVPSLILLLAFLLMGALFWSRHPKYTSPVSKFDTNAPQRLGSPDSH